MHFMLKRATVKDKIVVSHLSLVHKCSALLKHNKRYVIFLWEENGK